METRFNGGFLHFLLICFVGDIAGQTFITPPSNGSQINSTGSGNGTIISCGGYKTGKYSSIAALVGVAALIVFVFCFTTCCGVSARRKAAERQRRRAESSQQIFNGYASLMVAVIFNLMASERNDGHSDPESGQRPTKEFKGPPSYEEAARSTDTPPPPYTALDLSRSTSVRQSHL